MDIEKIRCSPCCHGEYVIEPLLNIEGDFRCTKCGEAFGGPIELPTEQAISNLAIKVHTAGSIKGVNRVLKKALGVYKGNK